MNSRCIPTSVIPLGVSHCALTMALVFWYICIVSFCEVEAQSWYFNFSLVNSWTFSLINASVVPVHAFSYDITEGSMNPLVAFSQQSCSYFDASEPTGTLTFIPTCGPSGALLSQSAVVRMGEGTALLSTDSATVGGGTGTYLLVNPLVEAVWQFSIWTGAVTLPREGGSLVRIRTVLNDESSTLNYFIMGGTSPVVETLNVATGTWTVAAEALAGVSNWMSPMSVTLYPAGSPPYLAAVVPRQSTTSPQAVLYFVDPSSWTGSVPTVGPADQPQYPFLDFVTSITLRESYVLVSTRSLLQIYVLQVGGPAGTSLLSQAYTPASTNASECSSGNLIDSLQTPFVDPDHNELYVSCLSGTLFVTPLFNFRLTSVAVLSPNPSRGTRRPTYRLRLTLSSVVRTALIMFSLYDDCSVLLPDGPFPVDAAQMDVELSSVTSGQAVFVCGTLGYCPSTCTGTPINPADPVTCVQQFGCLYNVPPNSCCARSSFPAPLTPGVAPTGSLWMLMRSRPVRFVTESRSRSKHDNTHSIPLTLSRPLTESRVLTASRVLTTSKNQTTPTRSAATVTRSREDHKNHTNSSSSTVTRSATHNFTSWTVTRNSSTREFTPSQTESRHTRSENRSTATASVTETATLSRSPTVTTVTPRLRDGQRSVSVSQSSVATVSLSHNNTAANGAAGPRLGVGAIVLLAVGATAALVAVGAAVRYAVLANRRRGGLASARRSVDDDGRTAGLVQNTGTNSEDQRLLSTAGDSPGTPIYSHLLNSSKYTLSKLLGKGGYGMVFLAIRNSDKKKAALKYITCRTDYDRSLALREFEVIMKVKHPNMIPIWDVFLNWQEQVDAASLMQSGANRRGGGTAGGKRGGGGGGVAGGSPGAPGFLGDQAPFQTGDDAHTALTRPRYVAMVTQYYPEGDLKRYCYMEKRAGRQLSEEQIVSFTTQICTLVVKLHDELEQIVHRDLKPENILLDCESRKVVVTDFGLAFNNVEEASHMTTQAGSLPFVAPECWTKHYDCKVDVWSLGCMVYAMCTQRVTGDDSRVMFNDVDEPWFADELRREVVTQGQYSNQLFKIMMAMLAKNPLDRPTAYQVEVKLLELMDERHYDMEFVVPTPIPRPSHALAREAKDDQKRREQEERAAAEAAARKKLREQRRQQRQGGATTAPAAPPAAVSPRSLTAVGPVREHTAADGGPT